VLRVDTRATFGRVARSLAGVGLFLLFAGSLLSGCRRPLPPGPLAAAFVPSASAPTSIRVTGLSSRELADLAAVSWPDDRWHELAAVQVEGATDTFVAGRYVVAQDALEFVPAFPFDAGRTYRVHLTPSRLVTARDEPPGVVALTTVASNAGPLAVVTTIHPDIDEWPANLLRFYVHFSVPMSRENGVRFVHVFDSKGAEVSDSLLESPVDFWSPDQKRFTVFFDPGRVKSDLVPNLMLGRALQPGHQYTVVIDKGWRDAAGRPMAAEFRKSIRVVSAINRPLRIADWRVGAPHAGSREPLSVSVPWPLDHALFERTIGVTAEGEAIAGRATVLKGEREWQFVPDANWSATSHQIVIQSVLEDVSGNLIDQPFEVDPKTASVASRPDRYQLEFRPR
jgi:hypothetical protein